MIEVIPKSINITEDMALIQTVIRDFRNIRPGMNILLGHCFKIIDNMVWKEIAKLNFEKDSERIQRWLNKTLISHPPPANIQAFWFGYANPNSRVRRSNFDLYILGSTDFNAEDRTAGWARLNSDSYNPDGNEVKSAVLPKMQNLMKKYELVNVGSLLLCLGYSCMVVKSAINSIDKAWQYGDYGPRLVAVGDDDGHFIFLDL
jgi:hypothetical protein